VTDRPAEQITLVNISVKAGSRGRHHIYGEAVNNGDTEFSAILGAAFYAADGTVMGTASGSVDKLAPRQTKAFWLRVSNDVSGYETIEVKVDCIL
jgi:hypothetical protein